MSDMSETICTYGGPLMTDVRFRRQWNYEKGVLAQYHLPRFRKGGLGALVIPVVSLEEAALLVAEVKESRGELVLAQTPERVREVMRSGAFAVILSVSFEAIGTNFDHLDLYTELGMAMFHLALNPRNLYVDGVGERTPSGLSHLGMQLVTQLTERGVLVDVSHTSDAGTWDVLNIVKGPVIASHSNARTVCDNGRNLPDDLAKAIARQGGLIGLTTYPTLVSAGETPSLRDYMDHMSYLSGLIGSSAVGVGADFVDFVYDKVMPKIRSTDPSGALYGERVLAVQGLANIEEIRNVADGLVQRHFKDESIRGILGGNFLRVWETAQERRQV